MSVVSFALAVIFIITLSYFLDLLLDSTVLHSSRKHFFKIMLCTSGQINIAAPVV